MNLTKEAEVLTKEKLKEKNTVSGERGMCVKIRKERRRDKEK